jgi:hypothetical protein
MDTVGFKKNDSDFSPLSATISFFPTDPSLPLNTVPEEKKLSTPVLSITPLD